MNSWILLAFLLWIYMSGWFVLSLLKKRNDVADVAWGLGFVLMAWASFLFFPAQDWRGWIVNGLVTAWGLRLAYHIYSRNKKKTEDARYLAWRQQWGRWFYLRSYLQVYLLQGLLLWLIVFPVMLIHRQSGAGLGVLDGLGVLIWCIGFFFESVGDAQLSAFLKNPANKGQLMQSGLWAYTRHPNYFGEVTQWWGIGFIALSVPYGWMGLIGPLTITYLILFVSGVPMLEKQMAKRPDFTAYQQRVSRFIPWFPRS